MRYVIWKSTGVDKDVSRLVLGTDYMTTRI